MQIMILSPDEAAVWLKVNPQQVLRRQKARNAWLMLSTQGYLLLFICCSNLCQVTITYFACVFLGEGQCHAYFVEEERCLRAQSKVSGGLSSHKQVKHRVLCSSFSLGNPSF